MLPEAYKTEIRMRHVTGTAITCKDSRETVQAWAQQVVHKQIAQHLDAIHAEEGRRAGPQGDEEDD